MKVQKLQHCSWEEFVFFGFWFEAPDRLTTILFPILCRFLCWAACILLLPPHGLVLETCSGSRSVEKIDDKESLTPNRLLSALGRKSPNPERRQLWWFFSTSEPHHQNPFALWFGPQYLRPSSRRCARWAQPNFQLHSSWIWIDPFGSFCNLPVQRFPPLSEGLGSASLNFCWILLLGCDWFLRVCCYCGHKKKLL